MTDHKSRSEATIRQIADAIAKTARPGQLKLDDDQLRTVTRLVRQNLGPLADAVIADSLARQPTRRDKRRIAAIAPSVRETFLVEAAGEVIQMATEALSAAVEQHTKVANDFEAALADA